MTAPDPADDSLAVIVDALKTKLGHCCNADSTKPMPERAQRLNGHQFYRCCLDKGHDGPHRWPTSGRIAEWSDR